MRRALPACRTCVNLPAMDRAPHPPKYSPADGRLRRCWRRGSRDCACAAKTALIERLIQEAQGAAERLAADRFHFRQAARRPLPGQHADRRPEAARRNSSSATMRSIASRSARWCWRRPSPATLAEFETSLRRIRYDHGNVQYDQRNHYFADWCKRNIENGICRPVAIEPSVVIDKTVTWHREFGRQQVSIVGDRQGDVAGKAPGCWRRATSSASRRGARASITITPASSHSARMASCCCAMRRKAAAASWTTRWRHSSPPIR